MPSVLFFFVAACCCWALAGIMRRRSPSGHLLRSIHRCRARPLFSQVGMSSFELDALVETCDDPTVPRGTPFSLRLIRPTRRSDYLFSRVRASVERGHALLVEVEDHLTARTARLCANGWTVVLNIDHTSGWPAWSV